MSNHFKVGDQVTFGRPGGEKTLGLVTKINRKSIKIETLEARGRGRGQAPGKIWNVHPSHCTLVSVNNKLPQKPSDGPYRTAAQGLVQTALNKLTAREVFLLRDHFQKQL